MNSDSRARVLRIPWERFGETIRSNTNPRPLLLVEAQVNRVKGALFSIKQTVQRTKLQDYYEGIVRGDDIEMQNLVREMDLVSGNMHEV